MIHKKNICKTYLSLYNDFDDIGDSEFGIKNDLDYHNSGAGFDYCDINIFKREVFQGEPLDFDYGRRYSTRKLRSLRTIGNNCCFHIRYTKAKKDCLNTGREGLQLCSSS